MEAKSRLALALFCFLAAGVMAGNQPAIANGGMMNGGTAEGMMGGMGGRGMMGEPSHGRAEQAPQPTESGPQVQQQIDQIRQATQKKNWALAQKMRDAQFRLHELQLAPHKDKAAIDQLYTRIGQLQDRIDRNSAKAQRRIAALLDRNQTHDYGQPDQSARALGSRIDHTYCARCHVAPSPMQHSPAQWPRVVARMEQYMHLHGMPAPSPAQTRALLQYLGASTPPDRQPDRNNP